MDSPYLHELKVACDAIQRAAKLSQAVLAQTDLGILEKDDLSPVTIADFAIQALLTATFHAAFPGDNFVGEESAADLRGNPILLDRVWGHLQQVSDADGLCRVPESPEQACELIDRCGFGVPGGAGAGRVWVFDPIDGTKNFVRGELYAINIALLEHGKQVLGVVGCPNLSPDIKAPVSDSSLDPEGKGSILFAVRGHGTYVRPLTGSLDDTPVRKIPRHAEAAQELRSVTCFKTLASGLDDIHKKVAEQLRMPFPGCDLLPWVVRYVALGLGLGNTLFWVYNSRKRLGKIWDHAGAMLLFEEVGGKITDVDGKDIDLSAGRKMTANYGFVAAPKNSHELVLRTVQDLIKKEGRSELLDPNI